MRKELYPHFEKSNGSGKQIFWNIHFRFRDMLVSFIRKHPFGHQIERVVKWKPCDIFEYHSDPLGDCFSLTIHFNKNYGPMILDDFFFFVCQWTIPTKHREVYLDDKRCETSRPVSIETLRYHLSYN